MSVNLKQNPFVVVWRVLDHCNLACPFCAYDKRLRFARRQVDEAEVFRFVDLLAQKQAGSERRHLISWLGGEPTLWKALPQVSAAAQKAGLGQSLTTNGTTLGSAKVRQLLLDRFDEITLSIDGFEDVHDGLRGWRGAFEKLRVGISKLREERESMGVSCRLRANIVLMRRNLGRFAELCHTLADWGIEEITFNQLGGRDRPEFFPMNRLRPADATRLAGLVPGLRSELVQKGTTLLGGDPYVRRIGDTTLDRPLAIGRCGVAQDFWFIDEEGTIAPCNFVEDHFGLNIRDLRSVQDLEALSDTLCSRQARFPAASCANCMSTQQVAKFAV